MRELDETDRLLAKAAEVSAGYPAKKLPVLNNLNRRTKSPVVISREVTTRTEALYPELFYGRYTTHRSIIRNPVVPKDEIILIPNK